MSLADSSVVRANRALLAHAFLVAPSSMKGVDKPGGTADGRGKKSGTSYMYYTALRCPPSSLRPTTFTSKSCPLLPHPHPASFGRVSFGRGARCMSPRRFRSLHTTSEARCFVASSGAAVLLSLPSFARDQMFTLKKARLLCLLLIDWFFHAAPCPSSPRRHAVTPSPPPTPRARPRTLRVLTQPVLLSPLFHAAGHGAAAPELFT